MNAKATFKLAVLLAAGALIASCGTSRQTTSRLGNDVDSVKVEVSTRLGSNHLLLTTGGKALVRIEGKQESSLSGMDTKRLTELVNDLFVSKTKDIIVSEEEASGRTCHPIFKVTLYRNGKGESKRYEMGDEANGITQCATESIRYSDAFREFMFSVFHVLELN